QRDAVAEARHAVVLDHVAGPGHPDALADVVAVDAEAVLGPLGEPGDDVVGEVAVGRSGRERDDAMAGVRPRRLDAAAAHHDAARVVELDLPAHGQVLDPDVRAPVHAHLALDHDAIDVAALHDD